MSVASKKLFHRAVPILIGLLLVVRLIGMATVPLMDTTEARYGEIGRKMAELNDWLTPWFDYGVPYWGKPPLSFWLTAASFKLFGVNEFAARLPHLIVSLVVVALIGWFAGRRDHGAVLPTAALLSGSAAYFISAGAVMTDVELVLGTSLMMVGFWLALGRAEQTGSNQRTGNYPARHAGALFFGGLILGLLAKGPVALVLAGTPLFLWTAYYRRWGEVWRSLPWIGGVSLTLLIVLPWYLLAESKTPGFLEYFFIGEHWHRFVTPGWDGDRYGTAHSHPIGTIWVYAFVDTMPWSILVPIAVWQWRKNIVGAPAPIDGGVAVPQATNKAAAGANRSDPGRTDERAWQGYLLIWAITPLLFFTAARNIIMTYALPAAPAAAVLAGGWLASQNRYGREVDRLLCIGLLFMLLAMGGLTFGASQPVYMELKSVKSLVMAYDQISENAPSSGGALSDAQSDRPKAALIFFKARPFSAEFYSRGHAAEVDSVDELWRRIGDNAAYVAVPALYRAEFIARAVTPDGADRQASGARVLKHVHQYGNVDLYYVAAR